MTVRTAICVLVMTTATAFGQDSLAIINTTKSHLRSGTEVVDQRRAEALAAAVPAPDANAARQSGSVASSGVASSRAMPGKTRSRQHAASAEKQAETAAPEMKKMTAQGKRDPFVSVIKTQSVTAPVCPTGKRCLVVAKIELKGIVRSANGMIAVVENPERKTYFLHVSDPVFNGEVVKIEPDGIVFREKVVDRMGRQSTREVVKRLSKPSV